MNHHPETAHDILWAALFGASQHKAGSIRCRRRGGANDPETSNRGDRALRL